MKIASIDVGSNSIKLVVVEAAATDSFAVLAREKEVVRLGHETLRQGHLAPAAIARAAEAIKRFKSIAEARGAEMIVAIATASVREADNAAEFSSAIERLTGVHVDVLSGIEEARLIGLAAQQGCAATRNTPLLNVDIGGGSTELSLYQDTTPVRLFSMKLGAVGLTEKFVLSDPVKPKELRALKEEIRGALERPARELAGEIWSQATGTSGTIISLGEALNVELLHPANGESKSSIQTFSGLEIRFHQLAKFNQGLEKKSVTERAVLPGISAQRAEIIIAGGQILEGVMRALKIEKLRTCEWALREGVIIDRLLNLDAAQRPPVPDDVDPRLRGVHAVGARFGYEKKHASHVARLAEKIFDELAPLEKLNRWHRLILSAAALLHDIGYHIAHESHHKHALYLIKHSEMTGFSEPERLIIANVARYHRRSLPKERHLDFMALSVPDRELVLRLSAILRVADALDRSHDSLVNELDVTVNSQAVTLTLFSDHDVEKELNAAQSKSEMFEQVFQRKLICRRSRVTSDE
ncbi:MAG TPA: Ppx/GppA phosphatase family protein [Pyrinomonadaceae bacterium]|nr:Ppx/GppA phosphatase family protein [Pyrinomonadaceae bacterium]